jgi:lipopolysaccharide export system permease protein
MKKLHWMILRSLPGPFFAAFGTLVFLLLLQFLITYLKDLVGRGLPAGVIVELVSYSLAYMVSLAVPMSLLLATLIVFGRLAETQAYAVAKSAGISLPRLTWPALLVGAALVGVMAYFNSVMLPEANHRMRGLWHDIRTARPGFELEPGVFYDGLQGYTIRVEDAPGESNDLFGILIFDHSGGQNATIVATSGHLGTYGSDALEMTLRDGEIHRTSHVRDDRGRVERYETIAFSRHRLTFDISELAFERTGTAEATRTGRTMRAGQLAAAFDSIDAGADQRLIDLRGRVRQIMDRPPSDVTRADTGRVTTFAELAASGAGLTEREVRHREAAVMDDPLGRFEQPPAGDDETDADAPLAPTAGDAYEAQSAVLRGLEPAEQSQMLMAALQQARAARADIDATGSTVRWERLRADRFRVEYYKKFSMALACLVFVLVGIPLGLLVRRRGYGLAIVLAVGVFLFYWVMLVQGEKLADRGVIQPWIGIWAANIIGGVGALLFYLRESTEPAGIIPRRGKRPAGASRDAPA